MTNPQTPLPAYVELEKQEVSPSRERGGDLCGDAIEALPAELSTPDRSEPGPFSRLVDEEWQTLLDKDDRTSPPEYPEMLLVTRTELAWAMMEAWLLAQPELSALRTRIEGLTKTLGIACDALDVADRLIERSHGLDEVEEWSAAYRSVAEARSALNPQTVGGGDE